MRRDMKRLGRTGRWKEVAVIRKLWIELTHRGGPAVLGLTLPLYNRDEGEHTDWFIYPTNMFQQVVSSRLMIF